MRNNPLVKPNIEKPETPVPPGMIRTKKGTFITIEKSESLKRARANAEGKTGRPKARHTLLAEKMRDALVEQAHKAVYSMVKAQIENAKGITIMMARKWETNKKTGEEHRTGEFAQVTEPAEIAELLNGDGQEDEYYHLTTKNPSVEAFKVLLEQSIGRPKESSKVEVQVETLATIIHKISNESQSKQTVTITPKQIN